MVARKPGSTFAAVGAGNIEDPVASLLLLLLSTITTLAHLRPAQLRYLFNDVDVLIWNTDLSGIQGDWRQGGQGCGSDKIAHKGHVALQDAANCRLDEPIC